MLKKNAKIFLKTQLKVKYSNLIFKFIHTKKIKIVRCFKSNIQIMIRGRKYHSIDSLRLQNGFEMSKIVAPTSFECEIA